MQRNQCIISRQCIRRRGHGQHHSAQLDDDLKRRLRIRAAENGRSMEQEAREILRSALAVEAAPTRNLGTAIRERFAPYGGVELDIPPRDPMREPPKFD